MSDLQQIEQMQFECLFGMDDGYVLGNKFSNRTFKQFIYDNVNIDIDSEKYQIYGTSKAKKLRAFIKIENNYTVAKILDKFLEVWVKIQIDKNNLNSIEEIENKSDLRKYNDCKKAINRLNEISIDVEALETEEEDFSILINQIKMNIETGQIEAALDRLHTYMHKYTRNLCRRYNLDFKEKDDLSRLFNKYRTYLEKNNLIVSDMSKLILKNNISILNEFNNVRNNHSLAHDNENILNSDESEYILGTIIALKKFIDSIEEKLD